MNGYSGTKNIHGGLSKTSSGGTAKKLIIKPLKCTLLAIYLLTSQSGTVQEIG